MEKKGGQFGIEGVDAKIYGADPLTRAQPPPGVGAKIYGADPPDTCATGVGTIDFSADPLTRPHHLTVHIRQAGAIYVGAVTHYLGANYNGAEPGVYFLKQNCKGHSCAKKPKMAKLQKS
jgi:hypothetical protein